MKRARACWTVGETFVSSEGKPEPCVTALRSVETTNCKETEGLRGTSVYAVGGGGLPINIFSFSFLFFWTNANSFCVRCFDAINLHKMCFWREFTNLLKNNLAWVLGVSQSDLAAHDACAAPGGTLTKTHANTDTCLKIQLSRSPHLARFHVSAADLVREGVSAFDLWSLGGEHPLGSGLFL